MKNFLKNISDAISREHKFSSNSKLRNTTLFGEGGSESNIEQAVIRGGKRNITTIWDCNIIKEKKSLKLLR